MKCGYLLAVKTYKMNIVNPKFSEQFYKGQDIVNYGSMIPLGLTAEEYLKAFDRNTVRKIKCADENIIFKILKEEHLCVLRSMWFDPTDVTFPTKLDGTIKGFIASKDGVTIDGGIIWKESGNNLFLYQLISNDKGKELDLPTLLIWHSVAHFNLENIKRITSYKNLDIGVSYNPKRQRFMQGFALKKYPVILKPPFYKPVIRLSPFRSLEDNYNIKLTKREDIKDSTFVPRASYGLYALLKHLDLKPDDVVTIIKTFPNNFISGCVTQQIEKVCKWHLHKDGEIIIGKVILIIHEFGVPFKASNEAIQSIKKQGIIIIEDCAWCVNKIFPESDYAIFSSQKMFNMNYGGTILGVKMTDEFLWSIGCLDAFKRDAYYQADRVVDVEKRVILWEYYNMLVDKAGMEITDDKYRQAITDGWVPTIYMQKFKDEAECIAIKDRLEEFGIQAGVYWGSSCLYLPIHQNMSMSEVEYMFAVIMGYFNLCKKYRE